MGVSPRVRVCAACARRKAPALVLTDGSDPELRTRVLKVTTVNLISLLLLSLLPLMAPVLRQSRSARAAKVGFWYNVLLNWPMFAVCFAVNAYWGPGVARRAQAVMHPA